MLLSCLSKELEKLYDRSQSFNSQDSVAVLVRARIPHLGGDPPPSDDGGRG
jgi:hypothetical protein